MAMDLLDSLTRSSPTGHEMKKQRFKLVLNLSVQTGFTFWTTFNVQVWDQRYSCYIAQRLVMVGSFLQDFPIGYCDHSSFPLCFFNRLCSQPSHSSTTSQTVTNCRNSEELWVKLWWHCAMTFVLIFLMRRCIPRVPDMINNNISSPYLHLSNGRQLFLQEPRRSYIIIGFPLGCCDHS
jgi:hypothetical protein